MITLPTRRGLDITGNMGISMFRLTLAQACTDFILYYFSLLFSCYHLGSDLWDQSWEMFLSLSVVSLGMFVCITTDDRL